MNFAQAKQNTGSRMEINAKIIKVWPEEMTKGGKRRQPIEVSDGFVTQKVTNWINADYPSMTPQEFEGREGQWIVTHSVYQTNDQYSGWPTNKPNTQPLNQAVPQPTYTAPQQAPQPAQDAQQAVLAADPVQLYIIRQSSIRSACELAKGTQAVAGEIIKNANLFVEYVLEGKSDFGRRIDDLV